MKQTKGKGASQDGHSQKDRVDQMVAALASNAQVYPHGFSDDVIVKVAIKLVQKIDAELEEHE